jgi:hypothetical protein
MHMSYSFLIDLSNLHMSLATFPWRDVMENARRKTFIEKEVTRHSNDVWEMLKWCIALLQEEDDELDNEKIYTPLTSSLKLIFEEIKSCIQAYCGIRRSKILLVVHEHIVHKTLNVEILSLYWPSYVSERFTHCNLTNGPLWISTSEAGVITNLINIEEEHRKHVWLFEIYKFA